MTLIQKRIVIFGGVFLAVVSLTALIIKLASGYLPDLSNKSFLPHGLLVATSLPDGAQLFLDGKLKSATNSTLALSPSEYLVEIKKDGFSSWQKKLTIKKELVTKADAYLFASFPDLKALTFTGAARPLLSPDGQRVVYSVTSASTSSINRRGLWVLDLVDRPLALSRGPRQIIASPATGRRDFTQADYQWSPDSKQILVTLKNGENFLLDAERLNSTANLTNITPTLSLILEQWRAEKENNLQSQINKLPPKLKEVLDNRIKDLHFSLDEKKFFYTATAAAQIPTDLIPSLPVANTQPEQRQIQPGKIYVYDLQEDKNFYLSEAPANLSWFPTSKHIFIVQKGKIIIKEYDGTNETVVYSGPFENTFAFPFPDGVRLLILASIGKDTPPNLYAVSLR